MAIKAPRSFAGLFFMKNMLGIAVIALAGNYNKTKALWGAEV